MEGHESPLSSLSLVKIEVELLSNCVVFLLDLDAEPANVTFCPIVESTVVEDKLHIIHEVLDTRILVFLQLLSDGLKVHGVLHDVWVVGDAQLFPVYRVREDVSFLVSLQSGQ